MRLSRELTDRKEILRGTAEEEERKEKFKKNKNIERVGRKEKCKERVEQGKRERLRG